MTDLRLDVLPKGTAIKALALSSVLVLTACGGDDNEAEIRELENRVDAIETRLDIAEQNDGALSASLDAIEARINQLETDIDSDIDQLEANLDVSDEINTLNTLLDALEERLDTLEAINTTEYQVTLLNASANQPLAPAALILHYSGYRAWTLGSPASVELETLAESGSPAALIGAASEAQDAQSSGQILAPGERVSVNLSAVWRDDLAITAVSMPVNTNDAFSGTTAWPLAQLEVGESMAAFLPVYDAGTEFNSETAASIPGPAGGGEGFNEARDDIADWVTRHPGVVSSADGYLESTLDESHRFDQGLLYVRVTRLPATD